MILFSYLTKNWINHLLVMQKWLLSKFESNLKILDFLDIIFVYSRTLIFFFFFWAYEMLEFLVSIQGITFCFYKKLGWQLADKIFLGHHWDAFPSLMSSSNSNLITTKHPITILASFQWLMSSSKIDSLHFVWRCPNRI